MLSFLPFMHNVAICGSCALWFYAANLAHGALPNWMPGDCDLCTRLVNAYVPVLARVLCVFTSIFSCTHMRHSLAEPAGLRSKQWPLGHCVA